MFLARHTNNQVPIEHQLCVEEDGNRAHTQMVRNQKKLKSHNNGRCDDDEFLQALRCAFGVLFIMDE